MLNSNKQNGYYTNRGINLISALLKLVFFQKINFNTLVEMFVYKAKGSHQKWQIFKQFFISFSMQNHLNHFGVNNKKNRHHFGVNLGIILGTSKIKPMAS